PRPDRARSSNQCEQTCPRTRNYCTDETFGQRDRAECNRRWRRNSGEFPRWIGHGLSHYAISRAFNWGAAGDQANKAARHARDLLCAQMKSTARADGQRKRKPRKGSVPAAAHSSETIATDSFSSGVVDNPKSELPQAIPVLIVDDHAPFRHGLAQWINSYAGYSMYREQSRAL